MITSNIYLTFNGNCEEAFNFYKSIFGGDFLMLCRQKELPPEYPITPGDEEKIYHIVLPISTETCLYGADYSEGLSHRKITFGTNFSININVSSPTGEDEARHIFNSFATKGEILFPFDKVFFGGVYGAVVDHFGIM